MKGPALPAVTGLLRSRSAQFWGTLLLFLLALPWLGPSALDLLSATSHGRLMEVFLLILIYAILALGLNVVVGFTGLLDLGYVAFMTVGAYTSVLLYRQPEWQFTGSIFAVLLIAGLHCALWGVLRGAPTLRLTGDYYAIVTLAFAEIVFLLVLNESWLTGGPSGIKGYPPIALSYAEAPAQQVNLHLLVSPDPRGPTPENPQGLVAEATYTPQDLWLGQLSADASPGLRRRYEKSHPDTAAGPELRFRNWDTQMAFVELGADAPWVVLGSGVIDGESPGSAIQIPLAQREPGAFLKPLIYWDLGQLAPGEYQAIIQLEPRFARQVLKDGTPGFFYLGLILAGLTLGTVTLLHHSRLGRAWAAIKADPISARSCGIDINREKMVAFAVSGFIGGVGGSLMAFKFLIVSTNIFDFWSSIVVLCCIVLGGMGNIRGVIIGALCFIGLGELLREPYLFTSASASTRAWVEHRGGLVQQILSVREEGVELNLARTRYLFFGLILVLFMIFRPGGLLPPSGRVRPLSSSVRQRLIGLAGDLFHLRGGRPPDA
ncbi:MAG: branched-chain amino acid ABC transporter permease [Candidatus Latescibacteria bacterium]|nr:branched-chain amino acid ABC transporter permease [Candidatus Latescibacterota bacterium]